MNTHIRVVGRRASPAQKEVLIKYLEENLEFAHAMSNSPNGSELLKREWEQLAGVLNSIEGARKSGPSWRKYWFDIRVYAKTRIDELEKNTAASKKMKKLNNLELRIRKILEWSDGLNDNDSALESSLSQKSTELKNSDSGLYCTQRKIRVGRASELQKEALIQYFEEHPESMRITNNSSIDFKAKQRVWIELTHKLNDIKGTVKPSFKWSKYWHDTTIYTISRGKAIISGTKNTKCHPTALEQRILKLIGQDQLLDQWISTCNQSEMNVDYKNDKFVNESVVSYDDEYTWIESQEQDDIEEYQVEQITDDKDDTITQNSGSNIMVLPLNSHDNNENTEKSNFHVIEYEIQSGDDADNSVQQDEQTFEFSPYEHDQNIIIETTNNNEYEEDVATENHHLEENEEEFIVLPRSKKRKLVQLKQEDQSEDEEIENVNMPQEAEETQTENNEIIDETNDYESSNDDLSDAIYALSAAANSLATAITGLTKVLTKRKKTSK